MRTKPTFQLAFLKNILYNNRLKNQSLSFKNMRKVMAKRCEICGKGPMVGNKISHAHNLTKTARYACQAEILQRVRVKINGTPKRIYVCTQCIRSGALEKLT